MRTEINREGTVNAIRWLEEEQLEANIKAEKSKLKRENLKQKMEMEHQKSVALYEMYNAVARCGNECCCSSYSKRLCNLALGMVYLCLKLKYIDKKTYRTLTDYLEYRIKKY